jgi:hypothetical protein
MLRFSGGSVRDREDTTLPPTAVSPAVDEAGDQAQRRGLAAARRAEQADQQPVLDLERYRVDHRERPIALGQTA